MSADEKKKDDRGESTQNDDGGEPEKCMRATTDDGAVDAHPVKQSKPITKTVQLYADKVDGSFVYYHHYSRYACNGQNHKHALLCSKQAPYDERAVRVYKEQYFLLLEAPDDVWGAGGPTHFILNVTHAVKSFKKNSVQPVNSSPQSSSHDPPGEAFCAESIKKNWLDALQRLFPADLVEEYATSLSNQYVTVSMASTLTDAQLAEMKVRIGHRKNVLAAAARATLSNTIPISVIDDEPKTSEAVLSDSTSARARRTNDGELLQDEHLQQLPKSILKTLQLHADEIDGTFVYFHHYSSYNGNGWKRANAIHRFKKAPFNEEEVRVHDGQYLLLVKAPDDIMGAGKPTHFILNITHALKIFKKNALQPEPAQFITDVELWVIATHSKSLSSVPFDCRDRYLRGAPDAAVKSSSPTEGNGGA